MNNCELSDWEEITGIGNSSSTAYTAPFDGYMVVSQGGNGDGSKQQGGMIYINDTKAFSSETYNTSGQSNNYNTEMIYVCKGDKIYHNGVYYSPSAPTTGYARWYKKRDYSNR